MTRPLLLVDVDGVLCPNFSAGPLPGYERFDIGAADVWLWRQHGAWLNHLANRFDLVWATTWEQDAAELLAPALGLPRVLNQDETQNSDPPVATHTRRHFALCAPLELNC